MITLDPLNRFGAQYAQILDAIGILPYWIDSNDPREARRQFEDKYQFGIFEMTGGTVDENGVYQYPDDPLLYPLATMVHLDDVIWFYQHAIVAIVNTKTGHTFVTRMD